MKVSLTCLIVGVAKSVFDEYIDDGEKVGHLKKRIKHEINHPGPPYELRLFLAKAADGKWLKSDSEDVKKLKKGKTTPFIEALTNEDDELQGEDLLEEVLNGMDTPSARQIHVLVVLPGDGTGSALAQTTTLQDTVWYGARGSKIWGEGVDLGDKRTLLRFALTADIIRRLEESRVLQVKSPTMTGKTSLAALVSQLLVDRHSVDNKKMVVFNFSALAIPNDSTFEQIFKAQCTVNWSDATLNFPTPDRMVYFVVDEVQVIMKEGPNSMKRKSTVFWDLVKYVLSNENANIRILMFTAYGSGVKHTRFASPVKLNDEIVLGIDQLKFSHAEVTEYVHKWFKGIACFEWSPPSMMEEFCDNVQELTGGHVGLCATAIHELNQVYDSHSKSESRQPLPVEWIRMLQSGSLYRPNDKVLFEALVSTRAVESLNTLDKDELNKLERIAYGANSDIDNETVEKFLQKGILIRNERHFEFSSPVMWRFFVKLRVCRIVRAPLTPKNLPELVAQVMRSIDYDSIRHTVCRSVSSGIPLERAWQLEFFKAVYRCTPSSFMTSADMGALFGSSGYVDFIVRGGDICWGIELLRGGSNLAEHIKRFFPGGRYSSLPMSEYCLIDFRRVASIDNVPMERIAADVRDCDKLFVVCYDARVAGVVVFNSHWMLSKGTSFRKGRR